MSRRVVFTGLGLVCPLCKDVDEMVRRLKAGESGVRYMPESEKIADLIVKVS